MTQHEPMPANSVRLCVSGLEVVVAPTDEELRGPIADLFTVFREALDNRPVSERVIVGLAGLPGSGKSTVAALLAYLGSRRPDPLPVAAVSIDGWHWPNAVLDTMPASDPAGRPVTMRNRKGSPASFDVAGIVRAIAMLRDAYVPTRLPVYDRRVHEPVAGALVVAPGVRLILLEGNYVLCREPPWNQVYEQLDLALFLDADPATCRDAVIHRHVLGGASREEAIRKYEDNDRANADVVAASRRLADVVVRVDADHRLTGVEILRRRARGGARSCRFPAVGHGDPPG